MRFCSCGKLLGNLLPCLPDMVLSDWDSKRRKYDGKIKELFRTAWRRWRLPWNFRSTRIRHFLSWQTRHFHFGKLSLRQSQCLSFQKRLWSTVVYLGLFYDSFYILCHSSVVYIYLVVRRGFFKCNSCIWKSDCMLAKFLCNQTRLFYFSTTFFLQRLPINPLL